MSCFTTYISGVYITESVHFSLRGSLAVFQSLFLSIGMLIVLGIGYCVGSWRTLAWVCMVPGIVCVTLMAFLHDTPYWLMDKNRKDAAM